MTSIFTHRQYVEIARIISLLPTTDRADDVPAMAPGWQIPGGRYPLRRKVAEAFVDELRTTNPLFDAERFLRAAMGEPDGRDRG